MKKLEPNTSSKPVRMIKRSKLKETVYKNLKVSGDPEHIKPTLDCALANIIECRLDNRVTGSNKNGEEVIFTLMGSHVYTWHNKELIEAAKECFIDSELCYDNNHNSDDYILELAEDDKRIFSMN